MISEEEMRSCIQEWMAQALCIEDLAKIYATIISETDKQLSYMSEQIAKERMEMQYLDDIDNPLEPLKLQSALQSEIFKFNYRKEHKPQDINILDYTVMYALKHCLEEQLKAGEAE